VSQDLINRYKQSIRLQFRNKELDSQYTERKNKARGHSATLAFGVLLFLNLTFAYLESKAFGRESSIPMVGFLVVALLAAVNLVLERINREFEWLPARLLACIMISMGIVIFAVYQQKYSAYHLIEFSFLLFWLGSLGALRVSMTTALNLIFTGLFLSVMYLTEFSVFWVEIVGILLLCVTITVASFAYLSERQRRIVFLQGSVNENMANRQESWAFTLIDLDSALNNAHDLKQTIGMLVKFLEPVIEFDSHILTSLEGQGPKPVPDQIAGQLFEDDEKTYWSVDLLTQLTQTHQATMSVEQETVPSFLGMTKERFLSYRLDVPIVNSSTLVGVISLRRAAAFDDLDMVASVSIATQAMLIFNRVTTTPTVIVAGPVSASVIRKPITSYPVGPNLIAAAPVMSKLSPEIIDSTKFSSAQTSDMELPYQAEMNPGESMAPSGLIQKVKDQEEQAKKTITLLSRENADKVAVDRYRSAATDGEPLSVLVIEVDGLSKLRELDGDPVAYKVFSSIVKHIFSKIDKEKDILGRYGQNGLSVLMPKVDMNAAEKFAEMTRQAIQSAKYKTTYGEKSATLSIGVAAITDDSGDYSDMVKRADMALFVAKKNGRNCVKVRL
jgi:diguanylate cyclase (GGDEF)-like protein